MAFTGVAVQETVSDGLVRITGLSLAGAAVGTIGLNGGPPANVVLPDDFNPKPYGDVGLDESLEVDIHYVTAGVQTPLIVKAGSQPNTFLCTITNQDAQNATGEMEIYVRHH